MNSKFKWNIPECSVEFWDQSQGPSVGLFSLKDRLLNPTEHRDSQLILDLCRGLAMVMEYLEEKEKPNLGFKKTSY